MSFNFLLLLKCTTMVSEIFDMAKLQATICCLELKKNIKSKWLRF